MSDFFSACLFLIDHDGDPEDDELRDEARSSFSFSNPSSALDDARDVSARSSGRPTTGLRSSSGLLKGNNASRQTSDDGSRSRAWNGKMTFVSMNDDERLDENQIGFTNYLHDDLSRIRSETFGIKDEEYEQEWDDFKAMKIRLNDGGASGAVSSQFFRVGFSRYRRVLPLLSLNQFFIFSKTERFIAKSCTRQEKDTFLAMMHNYTEHHRRNPKSYLVRIVGVAKLKMFFKDYYFLVMENIFWKNLHDDLQIEGQLIQERYDIKGSFVNRNAKQPQNGDIVTCQFCNQKYKVKKNLFSGGSSNKRLNDYGMRASVSHIDDVRQSEDICPERVSAPHQPNITMKDNDLNYRVKLREQEAIATAKQLRKDAEFLKDLGIMDYSLLLGVRKDDQEIIPDAEILSLRKGDRCRIIKSVENQRSTMFGQECIVVDPFWAKGMVKVMIEGLPDPFKSYEPDHLVLIEAAQSARKSNGPKHQRKVASHIEGPKFYFIGMIDILQVNNANDADCVEINDCSMENLASGMGLE